MTKEEEKYTTLDTELCKWWVITLFGMAKSLACKTNNFDDAREIQSAQDKIIKALEQQFSEDWYDVSSDEMTLEQARQAVKDLRKKLAEQQLNDEAIKYSECNNIDIQKFTEAIKRQPLQVINHLSEQDCVSRKQALSAIRNLYPSTPFVRINLEKWHEENKKYFECEDIIKALPSVTPTHGTCKDCERGQKCEHGVYCTNLGGTNEEGWYCADFERRK